MQILNLKLAVTFTENFLLKCIIQMKEKMDRLSGVYQSQYRKHIVPKVIQTLMKGNNSAYSGPFYDIINNIVFNKS